MIDVIIVDDHALIRAGVVKTLSGEADMRLVGEANNIPELFKVLEHVAASIILLDITMPGRSGLEVLREIKKSKPKLPVLVLSMHPENQFAVRVLKFTRVIQKEPKAAEMIAWLVKRAERIRNGSVGVRFSYRGQTLRAVLEEEEVVSNQ